jgi:hypothetical protein
MTKRPLGCVESVAEDETETNISMRLDFDDLPDRFGVFGVC